MLDPIRQATDDVQAQLNDALTAWATERQQLLDRIAELEHPAPAARFPGDPGAGRILLGTASSGSLDRTRALEQAGGKPLWRRRYWNDGISDLALDGPVVKAIKADHADGRVPVVSVKTDVAATAAGKDDDVLRAFVAWVEQQPLPVALIDHHEPSNDKVGSKQYATDFRGCQQRIRQVITEVTGGKPQRLTFGGSLMAYLWTKQAQEVKGFRPPDEWFPGDGVWDWCGVDQYAQKAGTHILDAKWKAAAASIAGWGVPLAVTELGIRSEDPNAPAELTGFYEDCIARGAVLLMFYDSDVNSTGTGWEMFGALLDTWNQLVRDPRTANARPA